MTDTSDSDTSIPKKVLKCTKENCDAFFSRENKLILHLRKHTGERPFVCDEINCNKTYTNSSHLRRHKKVNHGEKIDQSVGCDYEGCGAILANTYSLKKHHNRKHKVENYPFKCQECMQGFHRKKLLQQHIYLHTGKATFNCDKCDMSFMTSYNLNKHKRSHKDYKCDCGEVFNRWSLMLAHRKICRKPRFICEICEKVFSHFGNLKSHKLTHLDNNERSVFVCPYSNCERFYFYKKNLTIHINNFHKKINENKSFKCTYPKCQVVLKTKRLQKLHFQRHFKVSQKKRKVRRDKGTVKKSVLTVLIGKDSTLKSKEVTNSQEFTSKSPKTQGPKECDLSEKCAEFNKENCQLEVQEKDSDDIENDPLLKECDLVLSLLNEALMSKV